MSGIKKLRSFPFLFTSLCFALGIASARYIPIETEIWLGIALICIYLPLIVKSVKWPFLMTLAAGFLSAGAFSWNYQEDDLHRIREQRISGHRYTAEVTAIAHRQNSLKVTCSNLSVVDSEAGQKSFRGKVDLIILKNNHAPVPHIGQLLAFDLSGFRKYQSVQNPYEFDFGRYTLENKIIGSGFAKNMEVYSRRSTSPPWQFIRKYLIEKLDHPSWSPEHKALIQAITIGNKSELDRDLRQSFANTGMAHILAVSGLHVGIVFTIVFLLLRSLGSVMKSTPTFIYLLSIPIIWAYALIAGFQDSVVRAALMISLFVFNRYGLRKSLSSLEVIMVAMLILLIFDPFALFSVGFQLSFAAVAGIVMTITLITKWTDKPSYSKAMKWVFTSVIISTVATLYTFPFLTAYFHSFSLLSPLSSLLAIPLAYLIVGCTLLLPIPIVGNFAGHLNKFLADLMLKVSSGFEGLSFLYSREVWLHPVVLVLTFISLLAIGMTIYLERYRYIWIGVLFTALIPLSNSLLEVLPMKRNYLIVYHDFQSVQMDLIQGRSSLSVTSSGRPKDYAFTKALNIKKQDKLMAGDSLIKWKDHIVQIYTDSTPSIDQKATHILVDKSVKYIPFQDLKDKTVILPAAVRNNLRYNLTTKAEQYNIASIHDIAISGPYLLEYKH